MLPETNGGAGIGAVLPLISYKHHYHYQFIHNTRAAIITNTHHQQHALIISSSICMQIQQKAATRRRRLDGSHTNSLSDKIGVSVGMPCIKFFTSSREHDDDNSHDNIDDLMGRELAIAIQVETRPT
jgi:hypothetical protein